MALARCPRCGGPVADSASACAGCARPVTLDLTARVPRRDQRPSRRPLWRDGVLLLGGAGGIAAASISDRWWLAGGAVAVAAVAAALIHYGHKTLRDVLRRRRNSRARRYVTMGTRRR